MSISCEMDMNGIASLQYGTKSWNTIMEHKHEARIWDKTVQYGGRTKKLKKS